MPKSKLFITLLLMLVAAVAFLFYFQNNTRVSPKSTATQQQNAANKPPTAPPSEFSPEEIDRAAVYLKGRNLIEQKIVTFLIEEELQKRISQGEDPASFKVIGAQLETEIAAQKTQFEQANPGKEFDKALQEAGYSMEKYREEVATSLAFENLFLPADPQDWPQTTLEILRRKGGEELLTSFVDNPDAQAYSNMPPMIRNAFRGWIIDELKKQAAMQFASSGLTPEFVFKLNGRPLYTKDALANLGTQLDARARQEAQHWLHRKKLLQQKLQEQGFYLSDADYAKRLAEYKTTFEKSIFPLETLVLNFKGFPLMDTYYEYFRLIESYRNKIAQDFTDENLQAHLAKASDLFTGGKLKANFILCSAYDFAAHKYSDDSAWQAAKHKADEIKKELDNGKSFAAMLDKYSDFPAAETVDAAAQPGTPSKLDRGRMSAASQKNDIKRLLGESEFQQFLQGQSLGDLLFAHNVDDIIGPVRGPYGYYFAQIIEKIPGSNSVSLDNANHRELLQEDYLLTRFQAWVVETMAQSN